MLVLTCPLQCLALSIHFLPSLSNCLTDSIPVLTYLWPSVLPGFILVLTSLYCSADHSLSQYSSVTNPVPTDIPGDEGRGAAVSAGQQLQPGPDGPDARLSGRPDQELAARGRPEAARGFLLLQAGRPLLPLHGHAPHLQEYQQEGRQGQGHPPTLHPGQVSCIHLKCSCLFIFFSDIFTHNWGYVNIIRRSLLRQTSFISWYLVWKTFANSLYFHGKTYVTNICLERNPLPADIYLGRNSSPADICFIRHPLRTAICLDRHLLTADVCFCRLMYVIRWYQISQTSLNSWYMLCRHFCYQMLSAKANICNLLICNDILWWPVTMVMPAVT